MDKKSNRTDLLAAGRKKLQQYRKKKDTKVKGKDGKGSSSVSSTKPDYPNVDHHSQHPQSTDSTHVSIDTSLEGDPKMSIHESAVQASGEVVHQVATQSRGLQRGDQVSVVGTMQEASSFDVVRTEQKPELDRETQDELFLSLSDGTVQDISHSDSIIEKLAFPDHTSDVSPVAISTVPEVSVPFEPSCVTAEAVTGTLPILHQQSDDVIDRSPNLDLPVIPQADSDTTLAIGLDKSYEPEGSDPTEIVSLESMGKQEAVDANDEKSALAGAVGVPVDLDELAEVLKRLPEGDFWYLFKSRVRADNGNALVPKSVPVDLPQTFQEQLYLTNISKDYLHAQLLELHEPESDPDHRDQPLSEEEPASLSDLQERTNILAVELAQCRSELEAAKNENMEFQKMYCSAKEESEGFSAIVDDHMKSFDTAVVNLSIVSAELVDCKVQLDSSLVENENMLKDLALLSERRNQSEVVVERCTRENQKLCMDLVDGYIQLAGLQQEVEYLNVSLDVMTGQKKKFEEEKEILVREKEMVSRELLDCRHEVTTLLQDISNLNGSLAVMNEERNKQSNYEEFLMQEIVRLSSELIVFRDCLLIKHQECAHHDADLRATISRLEHLSEENIILQSSLEIYKAKVSEVDSRHAHMSSAGQGFQAHIGTVAVASEENFVTDDAELVVSTVSLAAVDTSEGSDLGELRPSPHADCPHFVLMKGCLEEVENLMLKLEKAVDGMHSHSVSLSRSVSRSAAPGVSKLIQAFESKASTDDLDHEGSPSAADAVPSDSYMLAKEQISHLRGVLKTLAHNVEHAEAHMLKEKARSEAADSFRAELEVEIEALTGISNNLTSRNIELEVLCGAMNQHVVDIERSKTQFEDLYEALNQEYVVLHSQNIELSRKLTNSHSRVGELHVQLKDIRRGSDEVASAFHSEIETVKGALSQNIYAIEREWKSTFAQLLPMIEKLDDLVTSAVDDPSPSESANDLGILGHFSFSLSAACEVIEKLMSKINADESLSSAYREVTEKLFSVDEEHSLALGLLRKISTDLASVLNLSSEHFVGGGSDTPHTPPHDPLDAGYYDALLSKLTNLVGDLAQLKESNQKLYSDLLSRTNDIEELKKFCLDADAVLNLILNVREVLKLQDAEIDMDQIHVDLLQSSVLLLVQKFKEVEEHSGLLIVDYNSRLVELSNLQGNVEQLNTLNLQHQNEILVLRESLNQTKDSLDAVQARMLEKTKELELSEQRVASVREKLSIAVAKGKGLVVHRDSLKQSLADMSSELEKCSQELLSKDSRILEVENKLKSYSEAGERMEALESELTYIRNSATALRESFFMKDSTLQRIEEIMEDLDLPDHFHSRDIVEKVDWLSKSVANHSLLPADWDQRSSVGGGSHSDAGVLTDRSKEDVQPYSDAVDDLRRKYEELQTKYFKLAEQNDMLEQSLTERNILVQRWEEILDRINTPPQIRAMEPEERIHWLGTALSEADNHMRSLQQKIEELESYCDSLSSDLAGSQKRISEHESSLQAVLQEKNSVLSEADDLMKSLEWKIQNLESHCGSLSSDLEESERRICEFEPTLQAVLKQKEILSTNLVTLISDHELAVHTITQYEHDLDKLNKEIKAMQGSLADKLRNDDYIQHTECEMKRLQGLILEVIQDSESENESPNISNIQSLERLIKILMAHSSRSSDLKEVIQDCVSEHETIDVPVTEVENELVPVDTLAVMDDSKLSSTVFEEHFGTDLRKELADALDEVALLRVERDAYLQKNQSMAADLEALEKKNEDLLEQLNQDEQKSSSLREKLNLAVRKGKSVVQQRDSLKQHIEVLTVEMDRLRSEITLRDNSLLESEQKASDLSLEIEAYKAFEAENLSLKKQLGEAHQQLLQNGQTLSLLLDKLREIDAGGEVCAHDPLQKLEGVRIFCSEVHAVVAASEQEASKSKKAAELLLAELNEVQDRNDDLQEELARACNEITIISRERKIADFAKVEALSHLAKFSEERKVQLTEFEGLKSSVNEVKKAFFDVSTLADDVFAKDIELLHNVKAHTKSCLEQIGAELVPIKDHGGQVSVNKQFKDFWSGNSAWNSETRDLLDASLDSDVGQYLKQLVAAISDFRERVRGHSVSVRAGVENFENVISIMLGVVVSQRNSLEFIKGEMTHLESTMKERDLEGVMLRRSLSLLYEACSSSLIEIENKKGQLVGQSLDSEDLRVSFPSLPVEGSDFRSSLASSEECVKVLAEKLYVAVREFADVESESREGSRRELKSIISTLQKELQEKDIQRERICMELVSQIKAAESIATNCSLDLQSMRSYADDLENKLAATSKERVLLEERITELQKSHSSSIEFGEEKIKTLTDLLSAKDQETEALMQALDEEENQMEALRNKIEELETVVQKKSSELEHVETSRAKAAKKLSVTVKKFDELHHMSELLLSEIENLQSQLQDRDAEVSFLRQEVTRCTNDALEATKMSKERSSTELLELLTWLDTMLSRVMMRDSMISDDIARNCTECKENLQKDIMSIISELEISRVAVVDKDLLLQAERNKVVELSHREAALEASLSEKELHLNSLQANGTSGLGTSEIVEVEPLLNKWTPPVASTSQVRSLRKTNNDQVAIAIDADAGSSGRYEDEEDDKVHGFKSLTMSRFIPKFTRPVSDMIDGLWVSCDRALMRQPALRLGIMLYWALLHAFLASVIV